VPGREPPQDKELTEQIADLTRQIHAVLTKAG
jgi:hypothetical protein